MTDKHKAAYILQSRFGFDCDYIPGYDDGEMVEPRLSDNEEAYV